MTGAEPSDRERPEQPRPRRRRPRREIGRAAGVPQSRRVAGVVVRRVCRESRAELDRVRVQAQARHLLGGVVGVARAEYWVLPDVVIALGQRVAETEDRLDRSRRALAAGACEPKRDGGCHGGASSSGNGEISGRHTEREVLQHGAEGAGFTDSLAGIGSRPRAGAVVSLPGSTRRAGTRVRILDTRDHYTGHTRTSGLRHGVNYRAFDVSYVDAVWSERVVRRPRSRVEAARARRPPARAKPAPLVVVQALPAPVVAHGAVAALRVAFAGEGRRWRCRNRWRGASPCT